MPAALHILPILRHTSLVDEPGEGRLPVDHQVKGTRVRYWRQLRASKTTKWETFPQFPLVLTEDGAPWAPACLWLLDRARTNPLKVSTLRPIAPALRDYKKFLDELGLEFDDFSSVDKLARPTYLYKTHLESLIRSGEIQRSTAARRMSSVVSFYRWLREGDKRFNFNPPNEPWAASTISLLYRDSNREAA